MGAKGSSHGAYLTSTNAGQAAWLRVSEAASAGKRAGQSCPAPAAALVKMATVFAPTKIDQLIEAMPT